MADAYWIDGPFAGRLAIVPRPRGGDWLGDELAALRAHCVDTLVSLLAPYEQRELALEQEASLAQGAGIAFAGFPIGDLGLPGDASAYGELCKRLLGELQAGKTVAIHCRMSIGRSGMLAASLLVLAGVPLTDAWQVVEQARGVSVPDTEEQRHWPQRYVRGNGPDRTSETLL